jgi:hypothetical protein
MCRSSCDIQVIHFSELKLLVHVLDLDEIFITVSPDAVDDRLWEWRHFLVIQIEFIPLQNCGNGKLSMRI